VEEMKRNVIKSLEEGNGGYPFSTGEGGPCINTTGRGGGYIRGRWKGDAIKHFGGHWREEGVCTDHRRHVEKTLKEYIGPGCPLSNRNHLRGTFPGVRRHTRKGTIKNYPANHGGICKIKRKEGCF